MILFIFHLLRGGVRWQPLFFTLFSRSLRLEETLLCFFVASRIRQKDIMQWDVMRPLIMVNESWVMQMFAPRLVWSGTASAVAIRLWRCSLERPDVFDGWSELLPRMCCPHFKSALCPTLRMSVSNCIAVSPCNSNISLSIIVSGTVFL